MHPSRRAQKRMWNKLGILPILTAHSANLAHLNLPLLFGTFQSEQDGTTHRTAKDIRSPNKVFVRVASKKLQNYYFPPRPTHRLSRPNRPITSMQMQASHPSPCSIPESPPSTHLAKYTGPLFLPVCCQPNCKRKRKKNQIATTQENRNKQVTPQTPLFACREA
jgi:hypothetical protein